MRVKAKVAQGAREIGGEPVQGIDLFSLDTLDHFNQLGEIGMVAERKSRVALITKAAVGIDRPAGENCRSVLAQIPEHGRVDDVWRAEQNFAPSGTSLVALVAGEALAELLVDLSKREDCPVQHQRETGIS